LQGDVVGIYDANGDVVARYAYDAWGKILDIREFSVYTIGRLNPIRYRGYYFDTETGFYYCQSRYYNPQWCRWISADVYMDTGDGIMGTNMYAYCQGDPVNFGDAEGYSQQSVWGNLGVLILVAGAIGFMSETQGLSNKFIRSYWAGVSLDDLADTASQWIAWAQEIPGFSFRVDVRGPHVEFPTNPKFLSRAYSLEFANDLVTYAGEGGTFAGYAPFEIAAEAWAHAIGYYPSSVARHIGMMENTFESTRIVNIDPGDPRMDMFVSYWRKYDEYLADVAYGWTNSGRWNWFV
jgi:RHS repeat-associated protein